MANNNPDVSVVICAYTQDRWTDLQEAVESVKHQTVQPAEIILVIDHNPALYKLAQEAFPNLMVIENQEARGLSGSRNSGIAQSTGQVIAFIDEDATASSDWIENLLSGYHSEQVIGVGGEVKPIWAVTPPEWFPEEFNWVVGCSYKGLPGSSGPVRNPIGCNMSFRRESLIRAGGFHNGIGRVGKTPVGCEETELAIRARQLQPGSIYLYQPEATVYHKVPEWRLSTKYYVHRCYSEGLSKAQVTQSVGSSDGLSSERRYVANTLPGGVLTGLKQLFSQRQVAGLKRAVAIMGGLFFTTVGYLIGMITRLKVKFLSNRARQVLLSEPRGKNNVGPYLRSKTLKE